MIKLLQQFDANGDSGDTVESIGKVTSKDIDMLCELSQPSEDVKLCRGTPLTLLNLPLLQTFTKNREKKNSSLIEMVDNSKFWVLFALSFSLVFHSHAISKIELY